MKKILTSVFAIFAVWAAAAKKINSSSDSIVCVVNGVEITDLQLIKTYTHEALGMMSDNLSKPGKAISSILDGSKALQRAAEVVGNVTFDSTKEYDNSKKR